MCFTVAFVTHHYSLFQSPVSLPAKVLNKIPNLVQVVCGTCVTNEIVLNRTLISANDILENAPRSFIGIACLIMPV